MITIILILGYVALIMVLVVSDNRDDKKKREHKLNQLKSNTAFIEEAIRIKNFDIEINRDHNFNELKSFNYNLNK